MGMSEMMRNQPHTAAAIGGGGELTVVVRQNVAEIDNASEVK